MDLWNVKTGRKRSYKTIELAKAAAEANYNSTRRGKGDPMIWILSCIGYSDEHWQGFEPHYKMGNGQLRDNEKCGRFEEPNWTIPTEAHL